MKFLLQRVTHASVDIDQQTVGQIGPGILLLIGIAPTDTQALAQKLCDKLLKLRVFQDDQGAMNRSILDEHGQILAISQFTLYADTSHGNRPGFSHAAPPSQAEPIYDFVCEYLTQKLGADAVATGRFGADMKVSLLNDGPVTILLEA